VARPRIVALPVQVIRDRLDVVEGVRVRMPAETVLPVVARALDHVEEVRDHAGGDDRLAVLVEIDAPGVRRAFGEDLELARLRMEAPDTGGEHDALIIRRA